MTLYIKHHNSDIRLKDTNEFMLKFFTPESVTLPVFNETFCDWKNIKLMPYNGPLKDLLVMEKYRKGKILEFYPAVLVNGKLEGAYRPEEHQRSFSDVKFSI